MHELPQLLKSLVVLNSFGRSSRPIGLYVRVIKWGLATNGRKF